MPAPANKFGRRPGRGIRPWLLLPKVLCVAVYLGSLASTLAIWLPTDFTPPLSEPVLTTVRHASLLIRFVAVPALLLAIAFGVGLLLQHPREFLRMRWLRLKLALVVVTIPAAHLYLSTRLTLLRADDAQAAIHARRFALGLGATLAASAAIVVLARLKPRLGQPYLPPAKPPPPPPPTSSSRPSPTCPSGTRPG
jgi:uncharacterized membrane protein